MKELISTVCAHGARPHARLAHGAVAQCRPFHEGSPSSRARWQALANAEKAAARQPRPRSSNDTARASWPHTICSSSTKRTQNRSTLAWKFVGMIRKRYVLMLTTTPGRTT